MFCLFCFLSHKTGIIFIFSDCKIKSDFFEFLSNRIRQLIGQHGDDDEANYLPEFESVGDQFVKSRFVARKYFDLCWPWSSWLEHWEKILNPDFFFRDSRIEGWNFGWWKYTKKKEFRQKLLTRHLWRLHTNCESDCVGCGKVPITCGCKITKMSDLFHLM